MCPRAKVSSRNGDFLTQIFFVRVRKRGPSPRAVRGKLLGVMHGRIRKRRCNPQAAMQVETRAGANGPAQQHCGPE
jgi:hypothetical protein